MKDPSDDWTLLKRACDDDGALQTLFHRHKRYVFRLAWGLLNEDAAAEDVVQDVFTRVRENRFKNAKPQAKFRSWLYQVAINTAREHARKRRRIWGGQGAGDDLTQLPDHSADPELRDALKDMHRALQHLPLRQREVVLLRYYEGFDTAETAAIVGCRSGTVKAHLNRATQALRQYLGQHPTQEPD
ncbi:MAG: RNA polymerase sigma factor [Pseudomonadota bacterium]